MTRTEKKMLREATDSLAYDRVLSHVVRVLEEARRAAASSVNVVITATY